MHNKRFDVEINAVTIQKILEVIRDDYFSLTRGMIFDKHVCADEMSNSFPFNFRTTLRNVFGSPCQHTLLPNSFKAHNLTSCKEKNM